MLVILFLIHGTMVTLEEEMNAWNPANRTRGHYLCEVTVPMVGVSQRLPDGNEEAMTWQLLVEHATAMQLAVTETSMPLL